MTAPLDPLPKLQATIGDRYRLERVIGTGGMGTVVLAEDPKHRRRVALKILRPEIAQVVGDRFLREIEILAGLQHPHILPLHDSCQERGCLYYVTPFVEGESLRERVTREGPLPVEQALRIATEVADALDYAHAHGVIHRDIKPENILFSTGHALLADFGIARAIDLAGGEALTQVGFVVGSLGYMSPEQATGDPTVDARSDVYSLACVLYEMLTGESPFAGDTPREVVARQVQGPPPSVRARRAEVPPSVDQAIRKAMSPAPSDRFPSAGEFVRALQVPSQSMPAAPPSHLGTAGRRRVAWAVAAVAIALAAFGAWRITVSRPVPISRTAVAVLPFEVRGSPEVAYLGEGMVNLLATKLDGAAELRSVDPRAVLGHAEERSPGGATPEHGRAVARQFGAGLFVLGDVVEAGGSLQITAALYQTDDGTAPMARGTVEGQAIGLFDLVDRLAAQLLAGWGRAGGANLVRLSAVTTTSLPAIKAFLQGEQAFRRTDYETAAELFQQALAADSLFALAWYRLGSAMEWLTRGDLAAEAAERALALAERLPPHDRQLLEANALNRRGHGAESERRYARITAEHPEDVEAWFQLAEVQFHYNPVRARPIAESRAAWERVLALEPDHQGALLHLGRLAAAEGDVAALDTLIPKLERGTRPQGQRAEALELALLRAQVARDTVRMPRLLDDLARGSEITQSLILWNTAAFVNDTVAVPAVARVLTAPARVPATRAEGYGVLAYREVTFGRWTGAARFLDSLAILDLATALEHRVVLATAPLAPTSPATLRALRAAVERFDPTKVALPAGAVGTFHTVHRDVHPVIKAYLGGLLDLLLGDDAGARRAIDSLERVTGPAPRISLAGAFAAGLRVELALEAGRPADAVTLLDRSMRTDVYTVMTASPFFGSTRARYSRGKVLAALGRFDEALRWFDSFENFSSFDYAYLAPARLERARLLAAAGRRDEAAAEYQGFLDLWYAPDPVARSHADEARVALGRLRGE